MGRFSCPYHLSDHCLGEKGACSYAGAAGGAVSDPEQQKPGGDLRGKSSSMLKKKVGRATSTQFLNLMFHYPTSKLDVVTLSSFEIGNPDNSG